MENRFTHHHYYIPEFYSKVLKNNSVTSKDSRTSWDTRRKSDFLRYIARGFPMSPIVLAITEKSNEFLCIDGLQRVNLIREFMGGGGGGLLAERAMRDAIEQAMIDIYISVRELKESEIAEIRGAFGGEVAASQDDGIKMISTNVRKIVATVKTRIPKQQINNALKTAVWNRYIGAEKGQALCCVCNETQISQREFDTGHVIAEVCGGTTNINNLRPICRACNLSMQAMNMEDFRNRFFASKKS